MVTDLNSFQQEWIAAWNSHDLPTILSHYADDIEFYSPVIRQLGVNKDGLLKGKEALGAYFEKGLAAYPNLHFEPITATAGVCSVVLVYHSINGKITAEYMELNDGQKITKVKAHYS